MFRDSKLIHCNKPHDESLLKRSTKTFERKSKRSETKAELEHRIRLCKWQLKNAGPGMSDDMRQHIQSNLDKCERQLANLPEQVNHKVKRTYKKLSQEKIREYTLDWIEDAKAHGDSFIMAEDIAYQLQVKTHFVKQVLQQLNAEGVVHQPQHHPPHDSKRDGWAHFSNSSMWCSDVYYIRYDDEEDEAEF